MLIHCLLHFLPEMIIQETLQDYSTSISICGRLIMCNLQFPDNIGLLGSSNAELQDLTYILVDRARAYRMEVNTEKKQD